MYSHFTHSHTSLPVLTSRGLLPVVMYTRPAGARLHECRCTALTPFLTYWHILLENVTCGGQSVLLK